MDAFASGHPSAALPPSPHFGVAGRTGCSEVNAVRRMRIRFVRSPRRERKCGGVKFARLSLHRLPASAGAPYVVWRSVAREDLVVTRGEKRKIAQVNRIRSFAACCGTHLFFEDAKDSDTIDVTVASFDDPVPFAPQKTIFLEDKLPWVVIDESIPSFQTVPKKKPNQ